RRKVVVPDRVMRDLEVPLALSVLHVDGDQAIGEEIVAGTMTAVQVGRGILDRQVRQPGVFVDGNLRPHAGVAVDGPRIVLPAVAAELTRTGNGVEGPQQLAVSDVEAASCCGPSTPFPVLVSSAATAGRT